MMRLSSCGAAAALMLSVLAACSNGSTPGATDAGCQPYKVPAGTDLTSPTSFKNDILPIFVQSCALSSACHGNMSSGNFGVQLGVPANQGASDPNAIYANIVGKPSVELPSMNFVQPSDPSKSYLMHKADGDQCVFDAQCTGTPPGLSPSPSPTCLAPMPSGSPLLDVPSRDKIRRWIAEGAQNN